MNFEAISVAATALVAAVLVFACMLLTVHLVYRRTTQYRLVATYVAVDQSRYVVANTLTKFVGAEPDDFYTSIAESLAVKHSVPASQVNFINVKPISRQQFDSMRDLWASDALKGKEP